MAEQADIENVELCHCGNPKKIAVQTKEGPNKGKAFSCCEFNICSCFKWISPDAVQVPFNKGVHSEDFRKTTFQLSKGNEKNTKNIETISTTLNNLGTAFKSFAERFAKLEQLTYEKFEKLDKQNGTFVIGNGGVKLDLQNAAKKSKTGT
jgi:uncharacterized protein (DUF927 family)